VTMQDFPGLMQRRQDDKPMSPGAARTPLTF
jgi:hypothetical protein